MFLKFGDVIPIDDKNYVYLDLSKRSIVYLAQIIDKKMTNRLLTRHSELIAKKSSKQGGDPVYKIVKLSTEQFQDMGAHCHKTGQNPDVLDSLELPIKGHLNVEDKKAIIDELLAEDGFVDVDLQDAMKKMIINE